MRNMVVVALCLVLMIMPFGSMAGRSCGTPFNEMPSSPSVKTFKYLTYDEMMQGMKDLETAHPELVQLTNAQQEFGIADQQGGLKTWILRLTNESSGASTKPEAFVSGELHGDERVGPIAAYELAQWLVNNYASNSWAKLLLDTRELYFIPMTNAWGWANDQRTDENGVDPNRDFPYDQNPVLQTIPAQAINELYKRHLFIAGITFHAGMRVIGYEWGSYTHNTPPYESPDDRGQDQVARYMHTYAGPFDGLYPYGRMNEKVYPVHGGMEDWGYAATWDKQYVPPPYTYPNDSNRAFTILVETSSSKQPSESSLGTDQEILKPGGIGDGHVPKNVRLLLVLFDSIMPYVEMLKNPPPDANGGSSVELKWQIGGAFTVDETQILWGDNPDPMNSSKYSTTKRSGLSKWDNQAFSENITMPGTAGDYYFVVRAKVDQDMLKQTQPDPTIPPQSNFVNIRTNDSWSPSNNGNTLKGHTNWYSPVMHVQVKGSTDPPKVVFTSPKDKDTNVSLNTKIMVTFSKPMDTASVESAFGTSPSTTGTFSWSAGKDTGTYAPSSTLAPNQSYTVTIKSSAKDSGGMGMQADYSFSFTTGASSDTTPPTVLGTKPANGDTGVNVSTNIDVTFSEGMSHPSAESAFSISPNVAGAFSWSANAMTFDPLSDLSSSTTYDVTVSTAASDIAGNKLASDHKFSFSTGKTDVSPPTIKSTSPASDETDIPVSADVSIEFSELVDQTTAAAAFSISPSVPGKITWSGVSMIFVHPYDSLKFNTEYTVNVADSVVDLAGNKMVSPYQFKFKTVASAPEVSSTTPKDKEVGVKLDTTIAITFSRPMSTDSVEGSFSTSPKLTGGTFAWSNNDQTVTYKPRKKLTPDTRYVVQLTSGAQDKGGVNMQDWFTFSFTTGSGTGSGPDTGLSTGTMTLILVLIVVVVAIIVVLMLVLRRRKKPQPTYPYQTYPPQYGYDDQSQQEGQQY